MYPITEAVMALFEAEHRKVLRITGTDKNGATITITDDNVLVDSFQIDRYSCNGEKLEVGTAIAAQLTFSLENGDGAYDGIVFEDTELLAEVGIADWTQENPTVHWVPCGYFTPDMQSRRLTTISVTALDRMSKFDVVVDATDLTFPTTIAGLVGQVCTVCGVTLAQSISTLTNADVTVAALPSANGGMTTYRNLIQWCAGAMGTNAWFDWNGLLRFSWYNNATNYVSTMDNRYNSDLYENDLTVTGVEYTNENGIVIVEGTDDYAIDLTGNAIAGPLIATVLPPLNTALNGFTYRPFTAASINAPYLWPMDVVTFTDKSGDTHSGALTNVVFGLNGTTALESKGMTYAINKAAQPKGFTREQAQLINQIADNIEGDIDASLTQQEIFNRLTDNGAAQGLILYDGQLYLNASYINAGMLNVERIDFNDPAAHFDVPDENDPATMLDDDFIQDGYIVAPSGEPVTLLRCDYAVPLRGMTVTMRFAFKSRLTQGWSMAHSLSDDVLDFMTSEEWVPTTDPPSVPSSPFKVRWVVPDDCDYFLFTADSDGVREITVTLSGTPDSPPPIAVNYAGLELNGFLVTRDGNIITSGKSLFNGPARFDEIYLNDPLPVEQGGTGADTAAGARSKLGITPGNIGAGRYIGECNMSVIDYIKARQSAGDYFGTFAINGAAYSGAPTGDTYIVFYSTVNTYGNAVALLALRYGSTDIYSGYLWRNGTNNPVWRKITFADGTASGNVAKTGDTMTGNLTIQHSGEPEVILRNTTTGVGVYLDNAPSGNHGVWSTGYWNGSSFVSSGKWLIYRNSAGNTIVNGNAENVTGTVAVAHGGTGATSAANARTNLGLSAAAVGITFNHWTNNGSITRLLCYGGVMCVLYINGYVNAGVSSGSAIMTIPSGYRPAYESGNMVLNSSNWTSTYWNVKSNGVVSCASAITSGHWFAGTLIWFIEK